MAEPKVLEIIGEIESVQTIAVGNAIRELKELERRYGVGRWRKMKGIGVARYADGTVVKGEIHWYEAHGIGKRKIKVKRKFR
jgi:hypothetical protein